MLLIFAPPPPEINPAIQSTWRCGRQARLEYAPHNMTLNHAYMAISAETAKKSSAPNDALERNLVNRRRMTATVAKIVMAMPESRD